MRAGRLVTAVIAAAAVAWLGTALYGYSVAHTSRRHHVETAWYVVAAATLAGLVVRRRRGDTPPDDTGSDATPADESLTARPSPAIPRRTGWVAAATIAASLALYWPVLSIGLLSDDYVLLELPLLPGARWEYLRPLPLLIWSIVHPIAGPPGLHAVNVLLHGLNAALLCVLTLGIVPGARPGLGWLAAALFLVSPLAVEPVAWAAGVFDTALVTWALGYLIVLLHARATAIATVAAVLCAIGALATKEAAVALPLLGALLAMRRRVSWIAIGASGAVCVAYAIVRASASGLPLGDSSWRFLVKELLGRPFGALGAPWTAADLGAMPLWLGVAVPIGFALLFVGHARGRDGNWRTLSMAAWVVAGAVPVLAYFFVAPDLSGSRYAYLPLVGWSILVAETAWRQGPGISGRLAVAWVLVVVALWTVGSHRRIRTYVDAARVRDGVLASAARVVASNACATVVLADPPSVHDGAYVLRNGLSEAMAAATGRHVTTEADRMVPVGCAFVWEGSAFVPRR